MAGLDDILGHVQDEPIPGGCDRCDAYQTMTVVAPGVYAITVHHDDTCPFLRSRNAEMN